MGKSLIRKRNKDEIIEKNSTHQLFKVELKVLDGLFQNLVTFREVLDTRALEIDVFDTGTETACR